MKTIVLVMLLGFIYQSAFACEILFTPKNEVKADKNGEFTVEVLVKWEHRKCVLKYDQIKVDATNVEIITQSNWKKVRRGRYVSIIKGKLKADTGSIRVWRDCRKKGVSENSIKIVKGSK